VTIQVNPHRIAVELVEIAPDVHLVFLAGALEKAG
tara:strand:- start:5590 stop:5694 length:105 start_codon:yes stop_codon:yes gene_type:complete